MSQIVELLNLTETINKIQRVKPPLPVEIYSILNDPTVTLFKYAYHFPDKRFRELFPIEGPSFYIAEVLTCFSYSNLLSSDECPDSISGLITGINIYITKGEFEASKKFDVFGVKPQLSLSGLYLTITPGNDTDEQNLIISKQNFI